MSDSFKRTLTDDDQAFSRQSGSFNRTDTSPELTAKLRNVGSRIRKSVMEGYITPPTTRAFTKAQSTTTIFSSAKDINRDVFGSSSTIPPRPDPAHPPKKRSRSADPESDTEPDEENDDDTAIANNAVPAPQSLQYKADRVIKPLRNRQGMMETRSLPAEAFRFSHQPVISAITMTSAMETEEDWTVQSADNMNQSAFNPLVFE